MKLTCLAVCLSIGLTYASSSYAQSASISLNITNRTVADALETIEKQSEFNFFYNGKLVDVERKISVNVQDKDVYALLDQIFEFTNVTYKVVDKDVILTTEKQQQTNNDRKITGIIVDQNNEPIIGANVIEKGTTNGTVTDFDGKFELKMLSKSSKLLISYIGYMSQEVSVKGKTSLSIMIEEDAMALEELVVVGYGVQKKSSITGSVSSIKAEDITKSSTSNITDALVGRMPGLIAVNESGAPGSGSKLRIRGQGTWNDSSPLTIVDGVERDFSTMDPNEIENVTILKDAAAAAVYGARAANGVILVTTKRGKDGKPSVKLNTYYGIKSPTFYPSLASPYEWATTRNSAYLMDGVDPSDPRIISAEKLEAYRTGQNGTDWYNETFNETAAQYYANLNLSGGSERVKYFVSLGHHNENALVDHNNYKKYNLRSNIDAKVTDRFSISADIDASTRTYNSSGYSAQSLFELVARQNPTLDAYHPNGLPVNTLGEHLPEMVHNSGSDEITHNELRATFKGEYKIPGIEGLVARGLYSYGKTYSFQKKFFMPYSVYNVNENGDITDEKVIGEKTKLDEEFKQSSSYIYNVSLNYNQSFNKHTLGLLFLYEQEESLKNEMSAYRTNFITNSIPQLNAGGELDKSNKGLASEWARNGLVGRVNYSFDESYLFEASFRYDGSIAFPKGNRYGFFPSVSAAWRMSNEAFIKDNFSFIDNLKLRASYGTLGNDRVALWQYLSEFVYSDPATIGGENMNSIQVNEDLVPNPDITWEKSSTLNVGLEGMFWNGLLGFEMEYYYKRTNDILAQQIRTVPGTFGATLPDVNYGILDNKGFEMSVRHNNDIGDFNYGVGVNFSFAKNKVIKFDESESTPDYYKVVGKSFTHVGAADTADEGRPFAGLVGMEAVGIFQTEEEIENWPKQFNGGQKPGDVKYADVNEDGKIDENDLSIIDPYGSLPEIIYGFDFNVGWKGLSLSALFQGAAHKSVMLSSYGTAMFIDGTSNYYSYRADDSWTPDNRDALYPRAYVGANSNNNRASNIWTKNGNYLRLKNVELAYTVPASLLKKLKVLNGIRLYVNGTNLLTFDNLDVMDPETSSGSGQYYPQSKSINFGVNLIY